MSAARSRLSEARAQIRARADALRDSVATVAPDTLAANGDARCERMPNAFFARRHYHVTELTCADGSELIDFGYRALLKREPDADGGHDYLQALLRGAAKVQVLGEIRWSPEGRATAVRVDGLRSRFLIDRIQRVALIGPLIGIVWALLRSPRALREQRAAAAAGQVRAARIDDAIGRERAEQHDRLVELADELRGGQTRLAGEVKALREQIASLGIAELRAETGALRHDTLSTRHWLGCLQLALDEVEAVEQAAHEHRDAIEAELAAELEARFEGGTDATVLSGLEELPQAVPTDFGFLESGGHIDAAHPLVILDCGSGKSLARALAAGIAAIGVTANPHLALACNERGLPVSAGASHAVLTRLDDGSCGAILAQQGLVADGPAGLFDLFVALRRVLVAHGCLRVTSVRASGAGDRRLDRTTLTAIAQRAGFVDVVVGASGGLPWLQARNA